MKKSSKNVKNLKPLSLYPLSLEEALNAALNTKPPEDTTKSKKSKSGKKKRKEGNK